MESLTIYDIAKQAGVSITTVSRVLNGKGEISSRTRERVGKVLAETGYVPSQLAKGLAGKKRKTVGIVTVDIRNVHHSALVFQAEQALTQNGYSCLVFSLTGQPDQLEDHLDRLQSHRVDGIIFTGSLFSAPPYGQIIIQRIKTIPCVFMNGELPGKHFFGIIYSEKEAFAEAIDFLAGKGRKNIALVYGASTPSEEQKLLGYREGIERNGLSCVTEQSLHTLKGGQTATEELVRRCPDTDAIVYAVDILAAGGIQALVRLGWRIPDDIAIIGSDNTDYGRICIPSITSIDTRPNLVGRLTAEALIAAIEGKEPPKVQRIACKLIEREST
jgi:LacI family transcriptional regulator